MRAFDEKLSASVQFTVHPGAVKLAIASQHIKLKKLTIASLVKQEIEAS